MKQAVRAIIVVLSMAVHFGANASRVPEQLESFELADLRFVGVGDDARGHYASVYDMNGVEHRVRLDNFVGRHYGVVKAITDDEIQVIELYQDASGAWTEKPVALRRAR